MRAPFRCPQTATVGCVEVSVRQWHWALCLLAGCHECTMRHYLGDDVHTVACESETAEQEDTGWDSEEASEDDTGQK